MATKVKTGVIDSSAITSALIANASITADDLHATLDLTGKTVTVATASAGDNDTSVASTAFVSTAIANLADSAPSTLNTLNELAAALGDDANYATTTTNAIAAKAPIASPTFTTTITTPDINITGGSQIGQDYAYLKSNSTSNASLTLRKDSSGADSIDFLQLRSDGNGLIGKIEGDGDISFNAATFAGAVNGLTLGAGGISGPATNNFALNTPHSLRINIDSDNNATDQDFIIGNNQTAVNQSNVLFKVQENGNVGIGTSSPDEPLHIYGSGYQRLKIQATGSGDGADLQLKSKNDSTQWILFNDSDSGNNSGVIKYVHSTNKMHFRTNDIDDRLVIDASGNVGIGTDSPSAATPLTAYYSSTSQFNIGGPQSGISNNVYYNGSAYTNRNTGAGGALLQMGTDGIFAFRRATSGSSPTLTYSMYIDGNGNVGIGTGSPAKLGITGSSVGKVLELSGDDSQVRIGNSILHHDNSANTYFHIRNHYGATSSAAELSLESGYITFNTGTSFTERMRVQADGNIEIGSSSNGGALSIIGAGTQNAPGDGKLYVEKNNNADWSIKAVAGADDYGIYTKGNGNYGLAVYNHNSSAYTFRVNYNGDILAVNTTVSSISDRRLKENIVDANSQWDDIKALKWKNYSWKESSGHKDGNTYLGLIADEVKAISPNLVAIEPQTKEDIEAGTANPEYENVKYSVVWLKAMKALQEAMIKIETLETKLEAAEARITTLEG